MSAVGSMLRHYSRAPDDGVERSNKTIDPDRTHLNYNLAADLHPEQSQKEYLENRLSEVEHLDYRKRTNINVLCDWVVTLPDNVPPEREKEFFKNVYDFLCERYGKENVISAYVHLDETTPHIHFAFVPVVKDEDKTERLCAKECISRYELQRFHPDLQKYCEEKMEQDVAILNGATVGGNLTINELKLESALKEITEIQAQKKGIEAARPIIDSVVEMMNNVGEIYAKIDTALKAKKWIFDDDKAKMKAVSRQLDTLKEAVTKASDTAQSVVGCIDGMSEIADRAVNRTFKNMRELQKKAERRIKREENKIRRAEEALKKKEQNIDACIQEGVRSEMLKHDAEIKAKQAVRDKLSLEIEEQERQLDIINTEFYGNEAFMRKARQNQQELMDTIQKWSKEYEN